MTQFSDLHLSPVLQENLAKHGFVTPTPVQAQAIPPALAGRDLVATAQTGTGKTLAFVLPLLERMLAEPPTTGVRAVILSPTRELAMQIQETLAKLAPGAGIRSALVVGGMNEQKQLHEIRNRGAQVLVATPGRLADFLRRKLVRLGAVRYCVLDEADRMLDLGFLPVIREILAAVPAERQTWFFSATIEPSVAHLVETHLRNPVRVAVGSATRPAGEIDLHAYEVEPDQKLALLHHMLRHEHGSFLVFARTRHGADRLAKKLARNGVAVASIHGDRSQSQRNQALRGFRQGEFRVLVATDVAARGIHVEGIAHVVNYELPQAPEDFIHRVGRTGRAGQRGTATTFVSAAERREIRRIEQSIQLRLTRRELPAGLPRAAKAPAIALAAPAAGSSAHWRRRETRPARRG